MKPKILIQALVLLLFTFSSTFAEPSKAPESIPAPDGPASEKPASDAPATKEVVPDAPATKEEIPDAPATKKTAPVDSDLKKATADKTVTKDPAPDAAVSEKPTAGDPVVPKSEEAEPGEKSSGDEVKPEEKDPAPDAAPEKKPKSLLEIRTEALGKFVDDELQNTKLEQEKKSQLRDMIMAAYREKNLQPLWSEAKVPVAQPESPPVEKETEETTAPQIAQPEPVNPSDLEKLAALETLLADHQFEVTALNFIPRPRVNTPECPVPLHDLTLTLGLAEVCLLLKQGPESVSEWPNWTFGDAPVAASTDAYYKALAERFGKVAAEVSDPLQVAESFIPANWVYDRILVEIGRKKDAPEPPQLEIEGLIKVGNEFPEARVLADFLSLEGHLPKEELDTIDGIFTQALSDALRAYQEVNSLQSDGILGPSTARKISGSNEDEHEQLVINLHRARRLPDVMGDKYLLANLPAGELYGFEKGEETIRMRIVFGKDRAGQHTPLFRDKMENVVFRPYWNVPYSIAVTESNYSNPAYLSGNGFKIISNSGASLPINYDSLTRVGQRKAYIRQDGGTSNALGLVKFLFPNPHAVYFHDTPAKHYFTKSYRAQSHGCVRLQKPEEMANWVLKDSEDWDADKIKYAIHSGRRNPVDLKEHIPVYIVYFTAFPDPKQESGVSFHRDYYQYDVANAVVDPPGPKPRPRTDLSSDDDDDRKGFIFRRFKNSRRGGSLFDRLRGR